MYSLDSYSVGQKIRKARKQKGLTVEELAKIICKSSTSLYKYERDIVVPDLVTTLEICNALDISVEDLTDSDRIEMNRETSINPFPTNILYIYYLAYESITEYRLRITPENGFMKVEFLLDDDQVYYIGTIESNSDLAFINLKNYYAVNQCFEKIQIVVNMKFCNDAKNMGVIMALREQINQPLIKTVVLTRKPITDEEKAEIKERLNLTSAERKHIVDNGFWYPDISNKSGFKSV